MTRPHIARTLAGASLLALAAQAPADIFHDDFESYDSGALPGGQWHDIFERAVDRPVSSPSITVIDTTDALGNATKAVQSSAASGTNGGFVPIAHAKTHTVSMDVRIDQNPTAGQGWPMGIGFIQEVDPSDDVNGNPQALIYAWNNRWRVFVTQGEGHAGGDFPMTGPQFAIGTWYRLTVTVDTELGAIEATVAHAATGTVRNTLNETVGGWNPQRGMFDAITMFDGEFAGATTAGQATVDNVHYVPAPAAAAILLALGIPVCQRRR